MKGIQWFTDPTHDMTEVEIFPAAKVARATTLCIGASANKGFRGVGVAITGASCYNLSLMKATERKALLHTLYQEEGLGLSVGRLSIGASDYSAELYSYDDVPFDTELTHFSIERDKQYILPMIKEILSIKPDLFLFASPWSPPGWMKTGGNLCGGYMREIYIDCYADYLVKFLKAYAENGIKIAAITPQNEPNTQQDGYMPACVWHPETEARFVGVLKKKLNENHLDVKVWINDHTFSETDRVLWQLENCEGLKASCDGVAFHYYAGTLEETFKIKRAYPKKELHFTEAGPRLYDHYDTDWCKWGIMLSKVVNGAYTSFTGWNMLLDERGGPNIGPFLCGGLVTRNSATGELSYSGQYKAFRHIVKYINEHSAIYPVTVSEAYNLPMFAYPKANREIEGFAIDNNDGKMVFFLVNPNAETRQIQLNVNGTWWYAQLTPDSLSTLVIE